MFWFLDWLFIFSSFTCTFATFYLGLLFANPVAWVNLLSTVEKEEEECWQERPWSWNTATTCIARWSQSQPVPRSTRSGRPPDASDWTVELLRAFFSPNLQPCLSSSYAPSGSGAVETSRCNSIPVEIRNLKTMENCKELKISYLDAYQSCMVRWLSNYCLVLETTTSGYTTNLG